LVLCFDTADGSVYMNIALRYHVSSSMAARAGA